MEPERKDETDAQKSLEEWYQERAAILEFMAGYPKEEAERLAREMRR
jgi:hypothetical protein